MAMDAENIAKIALRAAERKAERNDYNGAKKFALRAQKAFPSLKSLGGFLAAYDVHLAFENSKHVDGTADWRAVLLADRSADVDDALKKQYKKMCLLTHPDKNSSVAAEGAFKLVKEAWSMLSSTTEAQATVPPPPPPPSATSYCWAPRTPPPSRGSRLSHVLVVVCRYCQTPNTFIASCNGKYSVSCTRCRMQTPQTVVGIGSGQYPF